MPKLSRSRHIARIRVRGALPPIRWGTIDVSERAIRSRRHLIAGGFVVLRVTARQIEHRPYAEIARIAQALLRTRAA